MIHSKMKMLIAREWLILVSSSIVGAALTVLLFFPNLDACIERYGYTWNWRWLPYNENPSGRFVTSYAITLSMPNGKVLSFAPGTPDSLIERAARVYYEVELVPKMSRFIGLSKFLSYLFDHDHWFATWRSVLTPYLFLLFLRSLFYSVRILLRK